MCEYCVQAQKEHGHDRIYPVSDYDIEYLRCTDTGQLFFVLAKKPESKLDQWRKKQDAILNR